jgi:hypothetical protein
MKTKTILSVQAPALVRSRTVRAGLGMLAMLLLGAGCGQEAPPEPSVQSYHPLVAGAFWEYTHSNWEERVEVSAATFEGAPAFIMSGSPDDDNVRSDSIILEQDGRVLRMTKDEYLQSGETSVPRSSTTYGVGFTRFNAAWAEAAVGFRESPEYIRVETPASGSPRPAETRKHSFEVISLSEQVTTPAGTFDCLRIQRTKDWEAVEDGVDLEDAETKTFWFARGVGKVQERNEESMNVEILTAFDIPDAP